MERVRGKAYVDGKLFRPSIEEARAYYSREDVQDEILGAMRLWRVRLEPGQGRKHRWFSVSDRPALTKTLTAALDGMSDRKILYPYLRIDSRRYSPPTSWDAADRWGRNLIIEMDGPNWRYCWDAMLPVLSILKRFGVYYWCKYTGHHSLHVVVPAENFPSVLGSIDLADLWPNVGWRLIAFFDVACCRPVSDSGYGCCANGTNMPYSLYEHSGLLNYPVQESEIPGFQPRHANVCDAEIRNLWRAFPDEKREAGVELLRAAMGVFDDGDTDLDDVFGAPSVTLAEVSEQTVSRDSRERRAASCGWPTALVPAA